MFSRIWTKPSTKSCLSRLNDCGQLCRTVTCCNWCRELVCPPRRASPTTGSGLSKISRILQRNTAFRICTPAGFTPIPPKKSIGPIGAGIFSLNRYQMPLKPVYGDLLKLVAGKDYFVITTNVDHCFQKAGFGKSACSTPRAITACSSAGPCCQETFDNEAVVREMVRRQVNGKVPTELLPCPSPLRQGR